MLRLTSLELERFRSFVEPARLDFPSTGLVQVRGNGSGVGKSSLFLAIAEALCVCPVPATQLKSWFSDEPRRVAASFKDDKGLTFTTKRESGMQLVIDGVAHDGAPKFLQEKLRELVGVKSLDWIVPLTYRPQGGGSFFLDLADGEKKEFLASVLGLDRVEAALEAAEASAKVAADAVAAADREWAQAKAQLEAHQASFEQSPYPDRHEHFRVADLVKEALAAEVQVKTQLTAIDKKIAAHGKARLNDEEQARIAALDTQMAQPDPMIGQIEMRLAAVEMKIGQTLHSWAAAQRAYQDQRLAQNTWKSKIRTLETELSSVSASIAHAEAKIAKILELTCPTCSQHLPDSSLLREHESALSKLFDRRLELQGDLEAAQSMDIDPIVPERPDTTADEKVKAALRHRLDLQRGKESQRQVALSEQKSAIALAAQERHAAALAEVRIERDLLAATLRDLAGQIAERKAEQLALDSAVNRASRAQSARDKATALVAEKQRGFEDRRKELAAEEDFIALIGYKGFLGSIFDEVLLDINQETNRLLSLLPNVSHLSMFLASSKTAAATKKQKKAITPIFRAHGFEIGDAWQRVFSGGQVTAIQLAIDLAVAQVVGRRTGVTPGWLILDEPFIGLPAAEVEQIMSVLHVVSQNRLVLVVHHDSQSQEMFGQTIEIHCENGRSVVRAP